MRDLAIARPGYVTTDCRDPERLAEFWSKILSVDVQGTLGSPVHYVVLHPTTNGAPGLAFQRVPEPKAAKNRQHLDLIVENLEADTARIVELGGRRAPAGDVHEYGMHWRTMLDPEGNEFCLFPAGSPPTS
jgi:predicted enzyme related to lactoylglutathione lyase